MTIHGFRSRVQGVLILVFSVVTYWVSAPIGLGPLVFMGVMKPQGSKTSWSPSEPIAQLIGVKKSSNAQAFRLCESDRSSPTRSKSPNETSSFP